MRTAPLFVAVVLLSGCGGNPLLSSPEGKLLDNMLTENLPDGKYEVVKWWPPKGNADLETKIMAQLEETLRSRKEMKGFDDARLDRATPDELTAILKEKTTPGSKSRETIKKLVEAEVALDIAREFQPFRFARLKYRFVTEGGGKATRDCVYWFKPGKVGRPDEEVENLLMKDFGD